MDYISSTLLSLFFDGKALMTLTKLESWTDLKWRPQLINKYLNVARTSPHSIQKVHVKLHLIQAFPLHLMISESSTKGGRSMTREGWKRAQEVLAALQFWDIFLTSRSHYLQIKLKVLALCCVSALSCEELNCACVSCEYWNPHSHSISSTAILTEYQKNPEFTSLP